MDCALCGKPQGKCLHFVHTEEFFLTNVPDLSQHSSVFLSLWIFLSAFISVLIKLSLNNAFPFDFTPMLHKTREAERGSQSPTVTYTPTVTLAFDWLRTVCVACLSEKVTLVLFILGHK